MKKKKLFCTRTAYFILTCFFVFSSIYALDAQTKQEVKGKITNSNGQPISGVTISDKAGKSLTSTNSVGEFVIQVDPNTTLLFNSVGYVGKEVKLSGESVINLQLSEKNVSLDEVVVVSYGNQKKQNITGAISQIEASEVKDLPVGEFTQKLQGRIPGVQINQMTGRPGQGMSVRIRGSASMNAGNNPLYVVDGQPITGDISNINPDEIESFSILKDASATALYGSRAANGVVLITTKRGSDHNVSIFLNTYGGTQYVPLRGRPDIMNAHEFATWQKNYYEDKIKYENWVDPSTGLAEIPAVYANPDMYGEGTDWYDILLRKGAPIQNYSLSVGANSEKFSTAITAGYFNQSGVLINTGYQRYSFRANTEYRPNDRLTFGFNIAPTLQLDRNTLTNSDGQRQIIDGGYITSPISPAINEDGSLPLTANTYGMFPNPNWLRVLNERSDNYKRNRVLGNVSGSYRIIDDLNLKVRADYDIGTTSNQRFTPSTSSGGLFVAPPQRATGAYNTGGYYSWLNENVLTYNKRIEDHNFDVLVGYTTQKYSQENSWIEKTDFPNDEIQWTNAGSTVTGAGSNTTSWSLESLIGRLNYDYKGKYLLSVAMRRDGSSRFGSDRKWGSFPSISVGWVLSEEEFLKSSSRAVSFLKLRASYGLVGNNNIGNFTSIAMLGTTNYVLNNSLSQGLSITSLGNTLLSWETTRQADLGFEIGFWDHRLNFIYDYYFKKTEGMLYPVELPRASGFSSIWSNIGTFNFWGHEIGINSKNLVGELKWSTDFNLTFNSNKVIKLGTNDTPIGGYGNQGDPSRTVVGYPIGQFYGFVFDGVYMNENEFNTQAKYTTSTVGSARMKDLNGDGKLDNDDKTFLGDPNPDFVFGINNTFSYKNWDLSFLFAGSVGAQTMAATFENTENLDGVFNMRKEMKHVWRSEENPGNGQVPRTLTGSTEFYRFTNSRWVFDSDYLALRNVTLGKRFDLKTNYIKSIRTYLSIQEALMFTKYPYQNPEVSTNGSNPLYLGIDQTAYPIPRTFTLGLNIGF